MQLPLDLPPDPARLLSSLLPSVAMREAWVRSFLAFGSVRSPHAGDPPDWALDDAAKQIWTEDERAQIAAVRGAPYATPAWTARMALLAAMAERVAPALAREWRSS